MKLISNLIEVVDGIYFEYIYNYKKFLLHLTSLQVQEVFFSQLSIATAWIYRER